MDKKKREIIITACLIIVFIWFVANGARTRRSVVIAREPPTTLAQSGGGLPSVARNDKLGAGLGRDPFSRHAAVEDLSLSPVNVQEGDINSVVLTGIVYDTENSAENYCIINSEVVKLGGSIAGFTLTGIKETLVILTSEKEGKDYELSLWDDGS